MYIKDKSINELNALCLKIRERIISIVSKNGGHLSSNMGAVELIVAMHYVFDVEKDPFIFDVSHQSYVHKLLTNRWKNFDTLRQIDGISGYTKPKEEKHDYFVAGHSSTSISLAVGAAKAIKLKQEDRIPVVLIGDGSMSGGMVYEAMNELGDRKYPCIIILNDNEMSISKPIGAISKYLSQKMAGEVYQKIKNRINQILAHFPDSASYMAKRFEEGFKLITPGILFEELGLEYIGPIDGHNLNEIISSFKIAKMMNKPVIIHAQTLKGKGYKKAEGCDEHWHGVGPFDIDSGEPTPTSKIKKNATKIYSENLFQLAKKYENIVGVTAAMPSGTGMDKLIEVFPERFWDVAIAEQHAVTSMSAMAKEGFKPYITIYSTFLQRAYDQIIHDCCIMNNNVVFALDRAGIVGEDGETHQGVFDISYLNAIPNISMCAPRDEESFKKIMEYSYKHIGPLAIRYPRGNFILDNEFGIEEIKLSKSQILIKSDKSNLAFIGYGNGVGKAHNVLKESNGLIQADLVDLVFVKPLDKEFLINLSKIKKRWYIFSDSAKKGGIGDILSSFLQENNIIDVSVMSFEFEDNFIFHGKTQDVEEKLGLDTKTLIKKILNTKY